MAWQQACLACILGMIFAVVEKKTYLCSQTTKISLTMPIVNTRYFCSNQTEYLGMADTTKMRPLDERINELRHLCL